MYNCLETQITKIAATDLCGISIMIINTDGIPDTSRKF